MEISQTVTGYILQPDSAETLGCLFLMHPSTSIPLWCIEKWGNVKLPSCEFQNGKFRGHFACSTQQKATYGSMIRKMWLFGWNDPSFDCV